MARVLIIEDSPLVVQMLTMVCQGAGHDVESCENFSDVAARHQAHKPELIITDLNLPDVPGGDTIAAIRDLPGAETLPLIIISGRPRQELQQIATASGAQGALSKDDGMPVIASELPTMIDELL